VIPVIWRGRSQTQRHPPAVAEIEHICELRSRRQAELHDGHIGGRDVLIGFDRRCVLRGAITPKSTVKPERVQVIVPPAECRLYAVVEILERLIFANLD